MSHPSEDGFWDDGDDDDWDENDDVPTGPVGKPYELLALHGVAAELFDMLKGWFEVADSVPIDLTEVDSAVGELGDPQMIIALAMRKLQALHLLATPGIRTTTDVVVAIINDLERAMVQAPNMWLKRRAADTDWDGEFASLTEAPAAPDDQAAEREGPFGDENVGEADDVDRFRYLHSQLHDAMFAVIDVSDGEIRELE